MNFKIVSSIAELPDPANMRVVYHDVETTSGDKDEAASKPYHSDRIVGGAITHDDNPTAYYIPLRHKPNANLFTAEHPNVPLDDYRRYMTAVLGKRDRDWRNHNIRFDAHFNAVDGVDVQCNMRDTLVMAKVVDMQRMRSGYGQKELMASWCGKPVNEKRTIRAELKIGKTKNYGDVDAGILGEYACEDVLDNRTLDREIERRRYPEDNRVWDMECAVTRSLFRVERRGISIDVGNLDAARERALCRMAEIEAEVERMGFRVNLSSSKSVLYFVTTTLNLPVVGFTKEGNPSMNGDALRDYLELEQVGAEWNEPKKRWDMTNHGDPKLQRFFVLLDEYRDRAQFHGLYAEGWMDWVVDGLIHPMYKQTVATGRMACEDPNIQQLNGEAKTLVVPRPGHTLLRRDYSQIEYRIIAALSRDPRVIAAYQNDPTTDFHDFVAKLCGIPRKPAKNVNFGIAFGLGEEGLIKQLSRLLGSDTAKAKAKQIIIDYDRELPKVKATAKEVKMICRQRAGYTSGEWGWIRTLFGRRRALRYWKFGEGDPKLGQIDDTRKAFNTVVQGTAADLIKDRIPAIDNDPWLADRGVSLLAIVHDEMVFEGPTEEMTPEVSSYIDRMMCTVPINLSVPLMTDGGMSSKNWKECG